MYNDSISPKCGEIWMCNIPDKNGSVQKGCRPVLVVSNDVNNTFAPTLNIIPLTSKKKRRLPVHIELLDYEKYGLRMPSTLLVEQIMTVSSEDLLNKIGVIKDNRTLRSIWNAISIQFPINRLSSESVAFAC